jgi:hypothetical protein
MALSKLYPSFSLTSAWSRSSSGLLNPAGFVDIVFYEEPTAGRVDAGEC